MIATFAWMSVSGAFACWVCSLLTCPTPPGYVGHHRYTGDSKQWLVYGLSEGFVSQIQTWNGEDGACKNEEARDLLAQERSARWRRSQDSRTSAFAGAGVSGAGAQVASGSYQSDTTQQPAEEHHSFVAYAGPFYLGDEYSAGDFRRVLVDHLITTGGQDPLLRAVPERVAV